MKRRVVIVLVTAAIGAALAVVTRAPVALNEPCYAKEKAVAAQPDTTSSDWRYLSEDVGMMLRHDERLGWRGRLYVRVGGDWLPVATDTVGDLAGSIPVR